VTGATETEIKLVVHDPDEVKQRLAAAGFRVLQAREFEANTLYDTEDRRLFRSGMLLRLRQAGDRGIITWKGPTIAGPHKSRPERETSIGSIETLASILSELGYSATFRYEKYRTEFRAGGDGGVIVLDETPIGTFLELEGEGSWIDETAARLGFLPGDYVLESYGALYRKFCQNRGMEPGHMVFSS
jgi:adenylate cyclase class 2